MTSSFTPELKKILQEANCYFERQGKGAFNLPDPIPSFGLPLRAEDEEPPINLQDLFNGVYDRSGYGFVIDYSHEPVPPLSEADAAWADAWLRGKGLR